MADKVIRIYSAIPADSYNASFYYRGLLPLYTMKKLGLPVSIDIDTVSATRPTEQRAYDAVHTDINLSYQLTGSDYTKMVKMMNSLPFQYAPDGEKLAPPSFVMDTDDDLFYVSPTNSAFGDLGYRNFLGQELKDGDKIWARHPTTNELTLIWEDGTNVDYARNKLRLEYFRENLRVAQLITTSGENTKEYILREIGAEHENKVHIYPNCIDFQEYPKIELREHPDEVRILWQGSPTHWEDMMLIKDSFKRVMLKYPHVKFIMWGADYAWLYQGLPADRVEILPWLDYRVYKVRLGIIGHDIAIAPLRATTFNKSRSAIKWYESSAIWNPAATLASRTAAFAREMEDGVTGMLFDGEEEFETKLSALIEDSTLRKTLASNAKDWMKTNRDPAKHALVLYEKYQQLRKDRLEWPEPEQADGVSKTNKPNLRGRKNKNRGIRGGNGKQRPVNKGGKKLTSRVQVLERRRKLELAKNNK